MLYKSLTVLKAFKWVVMRYIVKLILVLGISDLCNTVSETFWFQWGTIK
jgi:hypothetical protein